jgi:hypothetical protein
VNLINEKDVGVVQSQLYTSDRCVTASTWIDNKVVTPERAILVRGNLEIQWLSVDGYMVPNLLIE